MKRGAILRLIASLAAAADAFVRGRCQVTHRDMGGKPMGWPVAAIEPGPRHG